MKLPWPGITPWTFPSSLPGDLACLEAPFSPEEIWDAVKRLPARKAPGPDGFTA